MHLMKCKVCDFQFKSPSIPEEKLLACYAAAEDNHWGAVVNPIERNFDRLASAIRKNAKGKSILDIGCFNGAFLEYLGSDWDRYGVEPCESAKKVAKTRGVNVLADTINLIPAESKFEVITAFDVIEHIVDPNSFFQRVRTHLAPGGVLVLSSGDTQSISWRLQGARYWYCSYLPEHFSFFCKKTLNFLGERYGMVTISHDHMSHKRTQLSERLFQSFNGLVYAGLLRFNWMGLTKLKTKFSERAGTSWVSANDHFIHVFRSN